MPSGGPTASVAAGHDTMNGLIHALNVVTLAAWLSVAGLGGVASWQRSLPAKPAAERALAAEWREPEIRIGGAEGSPGEPTATEKPANEEPASEPVAPAEPVAALPAPPELPVDVEMPPLPEVPDLPRVGSTERPAESAAGAIPAARPSRRTSEGTPNRGGAAVGGTTGGAGGGGSPGARLAAGTMPPPVYPPEARRRNQEGTVMIAFTVDADGSVIGARVARPSPWPLLNEAAVHAVRRWHFPAGPVMNLQQPVVFQLR